MATKLWTLHFMRICLANLLLFISLYLLYPVLPVVMASRLGVPVSQTGGIYILFTLAMFFIGPFHAYLVDVYKRKYICMLSFGIMVAATAGYTLVQSATHLLLLCLVQGISFGMAATAGITLAIDVTNSTFRSAGNVVFSWAARLGMIIGTALGVFLFRTHGFETLLYVSVASGALGMLFVSRVYVPFRAPIGMKVCSMDRFLLPRGFIPAFNLMLIAFVPGLLLPVLAGAPSDVPVGGELIPFFALAGVGFLLSVMVVRLFFRYDNKIWLQIVTGLITMIGAMALLFSPETGWNVPAAILMGLGLGLVTPEFLMMFVKLSQHCQRGTANTTHLLAWELGVGLGIASASHLHLTANEHVVCRVGLLAAIVALAFFVLITYPYFKRKKVR
ncbi:MFS transporter [Bacteroides fragilis]|uniref:MFS transporter n=1 Tax=Bacteroides fragilis TaxID=817 RepID=UPI00202E116B|nr:MFS transporter [Bacteroides fragilis]MCM0245582.1 MFS transporter [Bacteroides fragilis]MCM0253763.1 MFS transporter [Bacteroides fragilis]MCM0322819.1 MFS transporter [Bacteroides fragilis]